MSNKINSYEAFAGQVQNLLKDCESRFKNLSKKEAIRLLEFSLKFPVEHEEIVKKLTTPEQRGHLNYISEVNIAKSNMVVTFLSEHGEELRKEAELKAIEEAEVIPETTETCGNCENCTCEE